MWRTCSEARALRAVGRAVCCALSILAAAPAGAQNVSGAISLNGPDGAAAKKRDFSGAIVWLDATGSTARPSVPPPGPAAMSQRNRTFLPHVLAIQVGTAVDFPNDDPFFHNVFSNYDGQVFDVQEYAPKTSRRVVFRRTGIVRVFCNIHETMSAVIAVLATPYFAVTGPDGRFQIRTPSGQYELYVWHERVDPDAAAKLQRPVTVGAGDVAMPAIAMPVSDRPIAAHKNKYGQNYAFDPSSIFYPGTRR